MDEYTYETVITTFSINIFGDTVSEEWEGILDNETIDFAVHKLLADNHLPESSAKFVQIEEKEVTRTLNYDANDLYGCGNMWSVSGDYTPSADWAVCQYGR